MANIAMQPTVLETLPQMKRASSNKVSPRLATFAVSLFASLPLYAEDLTSLSLDQLMSIEVVTASKFAQKANEAPSSVTVVTADDIRTFGYRSLGDVLRSVRGTYVSYDRNYSYLGTRGFGRPGDYNTRLLVLVDGQRLNDNIYGQGSIGNEFPIDVSLIERVEFVSGPGSALYGSNAFLGVLNVITKKTGTSTSGVVSLEAATHGTESGRVEGTARFANGGSLLLHVSGMNSRGADLYFPEFDGVATGRDYERLQRVFAKYTFGEMTLESYFGKRTKGVPTASFGQQFNDSRSKTIDRYAVATANIEHELSPTLNLHLSLGLAQYVYGGDYATSPDATALNRDYGKSNTVTGELRLQYKGWHGHMMTYGVDVFDDTARLQRNFNPEPYASYLNDNHPKHGVALYAQDEIRIGEKLIFNIGVRHDHDSENGGSTNPRLGLIFKPTPELTTKLLYGTAFRSPNALEAYYVTDATRYKQASNLQPEHIKTYELVAEYFPRNDFRTSASLYRYKLDNLISLSIDPADQLLFFKNADTATARGIEIEGEWLPTDRSRLKASAAFQVARDRNGQRLTNSPAQVFKLNYSLPILRTNARVGIEDQYTSRRDTVVGGAVGAFSVLNLTVSQIQLGNGVELAGSIYNLLGKNFADPPSDEHFDNSTPTRYLQGIRQDGRVFRLVLTSRF